MLVEILSIFTIFSGGAFLVRAYGINGWGLPALAFVAGISFMIVIGTIQVIARQPMIPVTTLFLTFLVPMGLWAWQYRKGLATGFRPLPAIFLLATISLIVAGLNSAALLNLTPDSYRYAQLGSLMESGNIDSAQPGLLLKRLLAVPLLHAPSNQISEFFHYSITPLLAISTAASLAWFCQKGLQTRLINSWTTWVLPLAAALLLLTNQFFIYNAFYVNGHILYALLLLLITGGGWLYAQNALVPKRGLLLLIFFAIPAIVITRPEGALHVSVLLLPLFVSEKFPIRQKIIVLSILAMSIITWNGFLTERFLSADMTLPTSVKGMLLLGIIIFSGIPFLYSGLFNKLAPHLLSSTEIALWLALLIATILNPAIFTASAGATIENVIMGTGQWGYSLIILGFLFTGALLLSKTPDRVFLRFPITTFIPIGLLLAFLRELPYRIGPFDSLNRMFLHIVPLVILFIVSSALTDSWGLNYKQKPALKH